MSNTRGKIEEQEGQVNVNSGKSFESDIIPASFWLGGLKVDVTYDDTLYKERKIVGEAQYTTQRILLHTTILSRQSVEQNFYHELTHWILYVMNEDELRNNEKFVDLFAHFLYQARVTETREPNIATTESYAHAT